MDLDGDPHFRSLGLPRAPPRARDQGRLPAPGEGVPSRRGRRGRPAALPGHPGRLRDADGGSTARRRHGPRAGGTAAKAGARIPTGPGQPRGVAGARRGSPPGRRGASGAGHERDGVRDPRARGAIRAADARPGGRERPAGGRTGAPPGAAGGPATGRRTGRRPARRPTTPPRASRSTPSGPGRRGTAPRAARTGRSTRRNTPIRASTARNTRPGAARGASGVEADSATHAGGATPGASPRMPAREPPGQRARGAARTLHPRLPSAARARPTLTSRRPNPADSRPAPSAAAGTPRRAGPHRLAAARFAVAALLGEASGCSRFAAGCGRDIRPGTWTAQIAVIAVPLAFRGSPRSPPIGTLAALAASLPATMLLSATGGAQERASGRHPLTALVLASPAYVGVAFAIARRSRTLRP